MRAFRILLVSVVMLLVGGSTATAQDSAYPPRLIVVSVSDSSVEAGAPYSVTVDGCVVGQFVYFMLDGVSAQAPCVEPEMQQTALVLRSVPGRASAELTAPDRAGDYVGVARIGPGDDSIELDYALEVAAASPTFVPSSAVGAPAESASAFSGILWMLLTFILGLGLASGFWAAAHRRD